MNVEWVEPPICPCGDAYLGHSDHLDDGPIQPTKPEVVKLIQPSRCRGCGARIAWWETLNGKPSPHDYTGISHFATCPVSERFRKPKEATK